MKPVLYKRCAGFTLVELMIAMLISVMLMTAIIELFVTSNKSYAQLNRAARLQENARYAINTLKQDLGLVRFFGGVRPFSIENDGSLGAVSGDCTGDAAAYDYMVSLAATQADGSGNAYGCISDAVPGTSVLVLKHARALSQATGAVENSKAYILANQEVGVLYDGADTAPTAAVPNGLAWEYRAHVYYIQKDADVSKPPALSRKTLLWNGTAMAMQTVKLVSEVEEMRMLFGVDSSKNGSLDSFFEAATINSSTTFDWDDVGAVQIHLLVRSDKEDHDYTDSKTYNLGAGSAVANPGDHYHRTVIHTTAALRNPQFTMRGG